MDLLDFLSSSSSSDDENEPVFQVINTVELLKLCPKNEQFSETTVCLFTDDEFKHHFRIPRHIAFELAGLLESSIYYPMCSTGFETIPAIKYLQIFLWFAGHEAVGFRDVAGRFNISISKIHKIIEQVSLFLSNMSKDIIKWPSNEEKVEILEEFESMSFPGVLGVIDDTHFKIDTPKEDPVSYYNRKKYYSIHMQAVCDSKRRFRDVFIGFPGSVHDSRVLRNSILFSTLEEKCGEHYILGDSAYPCLKNLLTPYKYRENLSATEKNFNQKLSYCRILVEHSFGILKQKFRMLYHIKLRKIENICHFIRACCVLHNLNIDEEVNLHGINPPAQNLLIPEDDEECEDVPNQPGFAFRNYIASVLNIQ